MFCFENLFVDFKSGTSVGVHLDAVLRGRGVKIVFEKSVASRRKELGSIL